MAAMLVVWGMEARKSVHLPDFLFPQCFQAEVGKIGSQEQNPWLWGASCN